MRFNRVVLTGHLTRDPELRYLPSQKSVASFGMANNRKWRTESGEDREEVLFVDCSAFGKLGELISQKFTKGDPILIEGRLKLDQWDDKNGGGKRSKLSIVVENIDFVGTLKDQAQQSAPQQDRGGGAAPARPLDTKPKPSTTPAEQEHDAPGTFKDADIPF
jgi:single-strand DNA-binding protein